MYKELDYFRPDKNYQVVPGINRNEIKSASSAEAIAASFQKVIKMAVEKKQPRILIFEDDIKFT